MGRWDEGGGEGGKGEQPHSQVVRRARIQAEAESDAASELDKPTMQRSHQGSSLTSAPLLNTHTHAH